MGTLHGLDIGIIGLGPIARHVALRIQGAGANTYAYHRSPAIRYELAREGISLCTSPKEIASKTAGGIIVLMLNSAKDMEEILLGEAALIANLQPDSLIIDTSRTPVTNTRHYANLVAEKGAQWIDAPVVGDELSVGQGNLVIAAGGSAPAYERALSVLQCLGSEIKHAGDLGAGQTRALELAH